MYDMNYDMQFLGNSTIFTAALLFIICFSISNFMPTVVNANDRPLLTISKDNTVTIVSKGNTTLTLSGSNPSDLASQGQLYISIATAVGGIVAVFIGVQTFRQSQAIKRKDIMKDIILPLLQEFNSEKMKMAKEILDKESIGADEKDGTDSRFPDRIYDISKLRIILDEVSLTTTQDNIKKSFDALLDFLVKLQYLFNVGVLSADEITYFKPYIKKIADNNIITKYIDANKTQLSKEFLNSMK